MPPAALLLLLAGAGAVSGLCPPSCSCDPGHLAVTCSNASLQIVPMTLNPELEHLRLPHNRIQQIGSASFQFHPELLTADLSHNLISSVQESTFVHNTRLSSLSLAHNLLASVPDLSGLSSLRSLDLAHNRLASLGLARLEAAPSLRSLDLSHNLVSSLTAVPGPLASLDISHNQVTRVHLAQECSLHHLDLSHNPLHHLAPAALSGLTQLRSLQLVGTQLASCPGPALAPLRSLQQLDLSSTQLAQLGAGELQLPQLARLAVTGCPQLARLGPGLFRDTPLLQHLNISHNPELRDWAPSILEGLDQLSELDISCNQLATVTLPQLGSQLQLRADHNPWSCDCRLAPLHAQLRDQQLASAAVCEQPAAVRGQLVAEVEQLSSSCDQLTPSEQTRVREAPGTGEEEDSAHYFYLIIALSCLSIVGTVVIFARRRIAHIISDLRRGRDKLEADEKCQDQGCEKSFIQYEEYFLSLARYQHQLHNPDIPVTEL